MPAITADSPGRRADQCYMSTFVFFGRPRSSFRLAATAPLSFTAVMPFRKAVMKRDRRERSRPGDHCHILMGIVTAASPFYPGGHERSKDFTLRTLAASTLSGVKMERAVEQPILNSAITGSCIPQPIFRSFHIQTSSLSSQIQMIATSHRQRPFGFAEDWHRRTQ